MTKSQPTELGPTNLMLSCKDATELVVRNEFIALSFKQRIALWFHLLICKACKLFKIQSKEINTILSSASNAPMINLEEKKKEEIKKSLEDLIN